MDRDAKGRGEAVTDARSAGLRKAQIYSGLAAYFGELALLEATEERTNGPASAPRQPYHQNNLPPGETSRSYLDKARACAFKTSKTGRSVLCAPGDWDAYVASKQRQPRKVAPKQEAPPANDVDSIAAAVMAATDERVRTGRKSR